MIANHYWALERRNESRTSLCDSRTVTHIFQKMLKHSKILKKTQTPHSVLLVYKSIDKKCNYNSVKIDYFYLAIIPFGANLSIHVLLIQ